MPNKWKSLLYFYINFICTNFKICHISQTSSLEVQNSEAEEIPFKIVLLEIIQL